jgi:hypothetical protein
MREKEARRYEPTVILVDAKNRARVREVEDVK